MTVSKPQILALTLGLKSLKKFLERDDLDKYPKMKFLKRYKEEINWLVYVFSFAAFFKSTSKFRLFFISIKNLFGQNGPENRKKIVEKLKEFKQYLTNSKIINTIQNANY